MGCPLQAQENFVFQLFANNRRVAKDYDQQVKALVQRLQQRPHNPIEVIFSQGIKFQVFDLLGIGGQNVILDIGNNQALRIRKKKMQNFSYLAWLNPLSDKSIFIDSLGEFYRGYKALTQQGVPVVEVATVAGHENEFLIVEKVSIEFDYARYFESSFVENLSKEKLAQIDNDFLIFVKKTAQLRTVGDFRKNQLVYTKEHGWILIDFTSRLDFANQHSSNENIFEKNQLDNIKNMAVIQSYIPTEPFVVKPGLPERLREKTREIIQEVRNPSCRNLF